LKSPKQNADATLKTFEETSKHARLAVEEGFGAKWRPQPAVKRRAKYKDSCVAVPATAKGKLLDGGGEWG